ncbi:NAD-binding protein [Plantactinospora mayteni]|uniref:NAD-binding protein n=1 Tax=Plantactinospora mayteni TaxID=566021 RepID=UPI003556D88F
MDVPVLGSLAEAEAGGLVLLAGGPDDAVARLRPLLLVLGEPVHLGPVGTGAAAKLVANLALLGTVGVLGEALSLADALGLPRPATCRALARTPLAAQVERRRPAVESGVFPPRFTLGLARKDADLIVAAADRAGVDASLARATRRWLTDAEAAGLGSLGVDVAETAYIGDAEVDLKCAEAAGALAVHARWGVTSPTPVTIPVARQPADVLELLSEPEPGPPDLTTATSPTHRTTHLGDHR